VNAAIRLVEQQGRLHRRVCVPRRNCSSSTAEKGGKSGTRSLPHPVLTRIRDAGSSREEALTHMSTRPPCTTPGRPPDSCRSGGRDRAAVTTPSPVAQVDEAADSYFESRRGHHAAAEPGGFQSLADC
jgi:hypothetical protein